MDLKVEIKAVSDPFMDRKVEVKAVSDPFMYLNIPSWT